MFTWVDDLLAEWRQRLAAPARVDPACSAKEAANGATPALDLLRVHIERSGVPLRLAEVKTTLAGGIRPTLPTVGGGAAGDVPAAEVALEADAVFGKRRHSFRAIDTAQRWVRLSPAEAGPVPIKRWKESPAPADARLAADAFRAAAFSEVEALRGDVARLKETLADILVENRELKRQVEVQSKGQTGDRRSASSSEETGADSSAALS